MSSNTDQYFYYIELASCYNHTDEHENAMALLEIALDLTQNKQEVLLSVLERVLDKYLIDDDGLLIRDIDIDRLNTTIKFTNFEVKDTKRLALAKKFLESNLLEFALKEVNKIDKKSGDIYHHIHGINLFFQSIRCFTEPSKESLQKLPRFSFYSISTSPNNVSQKGNEESQSNLNSRDQVNYRKLRD